MTAHIHAACIIAAAEDTNRAVEFWIGSKQSWYHTEYREWRPSYRYRVIDHDGNVIAETPAPKPRRVRIPETTLPAPLKSTGGSPAWSDSTADVWTIDNPLKWATKEEAQEWLDFLTADREVVEDE